MRAVIHKGNIKDTVIRVPSSKSVLNRMIIAASAADGVSVLNSVSYSDDINEMISAAENMGAVIEKENDCLHIHGFMGKPCLKNSDIYFYDSASALRFSMPLLALSEEKVSLHAGKRLRARGISVYEELFQEKELYLKGTDDGWIMQGKLPAGDYKADGSLSSQYISGLMCALPLLKNDSRIIVRNRFVSEPYAELTRIVLARAGIVVNRDENTYLIRGDQKYHPFEADIPGDDSQASFFAALALLSGKDMHVTNMAHDSLQGDHVITDLIRRFGGTVRKDSSGYVFSGGHPKPAEADLSNIPDLGPVLFACAAAAEGESVFTNTERLRQKESDRISTMCRELEKFGCLTNEENNILRIRGTGKLKTPGILSGHNDHRVVMALSVLAACLDEPAVIEGAESVNKSYPAFFEDLKKTGASVTLCD